MVIPHELHDSVFVYLDDLLIVSATFEKHLEFLQRAIFLISANFTINVKKSQFCMRVIKYFGYLVGESDFRIDPDKDSAIAMSKKIT